MFQIYLQVDLLLATLLFAITVIPKDVADIKNFSHVKGLYMEIMLFLIGIICLYFAAVPLSKRKFFTEAVKKNIAVIAKTSLLIPTCMLNSLW